MPPYKRKTEPPVLCAICDKPSSARRPHIADRNTQLCYTCYTNVKWLLQNYYRILYHIEDKEKPWH